MAIVTIDADAEGWVYLGEGQWIRDIPADETRLPECEQCGRPIAHHCNTCGNCACDGRG